MQQRSPQPLLLTYPEFQGLSPIRNHVVHVRPKLPWRLRSHLSSLRSCIFPLLLPSFPFYPRLSRISLLFPAMDHNTLVFDTFNVDLVAKVLANTAFSPFFTGMIPVFYYFHVGTLKNDTVVGSFYYFLLVSSFCASTILSRFGSA